MTPIEQSQIDAIERDRRKRERELLALLLLFFGDAINHAAYAVRLGHSAQAAASNVLLGNPSLGLMGLATPLCRLLATTYADGIIRAYRMSDTPPPEPATLMPGAMEIYRPAAQGIANTLSNTLSAKIDAIMDGDGMVGLTARQTSTLLKSLLKSGGYGYGMKPDGTRTDPYLIETTTELAIVNAHGAGMSIGSDAPEVALKIWGFKFVAVLDEVTTKICKKCNGTRLPRGDIWFKTHTPSMHFNCRSALLPIYVGASNAYATDAPDIEPMPGFGRPWLGTGLAA